MHGHGLHRCRRRLCLDFRRVARDIARDIGSRRTCRCRSPVDVGREWLGVVCGGVLRGSSIGSVARCALTAITAITVTRSATSLIALPARRRVRAGAVAVRNECSRFLVNSRHRFDVRTGSRFERLGGTFAATITSSIGPVCPVRAFGALGTWTAVLACRTLAALARNCLAVLLGRRAGAFHRGVHTAFLALAAPATFPAAAGRAVTGHRRRIGACRKHCTSLRGGDVGSFCDRQSAFAITPFSPPAAFTLAWRTCLARFACFTGLARLTDFARFTRDAIDPGLAAARFACVTALLAGAFTTFAVPAPACFIAATSTFTAAFTTLAVTALFARSLATLAVTTPTRFVAATAPLFAIASRAGITVTARTTVGANRLGRRSNRRRGCR